MAEPLPVATVVHAIEGRTRLRVVERRGDFMFFASASAALSKTSGVRSAQAAPLTGGLLIFHDAPLARIGEAAEQAGLFRIAEDSAQNSPSAEGVRISARALATAGLGALALWQLYRERFLPPALTIAWYAANLAGVATNGKNWAAEE